MTFYTLSNAKFYNEVDGKDKLLLSQWDFVCKHVGSKKAKRILGLK
jgi:hypothetical protein